jgi:hypothetical protein
MKKVIFVALAALAVSSAAFADEYVGVGVGTTNNTPTTQRSTYGVATYGQNLGQLTVDVRATLVQANTPSNTVSNFIETGVRYNLADVAGLKPFVRVAVGEQISSTGNRTYASVQPGVGYQVTSALRADVSVTRAVTTSRVVGVAVDSTSYAVGATYALNATNSVGVEYSHAVGAVGSISPTGTNAVFVGLTHTL